jgi:hypothetical protein
MIKDNSPNKAEIIYELKGINFWRYLMLTIFALAFIVLTFNISLLGIIAIILYLILLLLVCLVRFPKVTLYNDKLVYSHKGIIKILNSKYEATYSEIKKIHYQEKNIDWFVIIVLFLSLGFKRMHNQQISSKGRHKSEQIVIQFENRRPMCILKLGNKSEFRNLYKIIESKITIE